MNPLDAVAVLLIVVGAILGWRSGAIPQISGLIGAIAAGALVILALPYLREPLSGLDPAIRPFLVLIGLIGAVAIGESVGGAIGRAVSGRLGSGFRSATDRAIGAAFSVVQAVLIVWLAGSLLADGPVPRLAETAGGSVAVRTLTAVLPPATEIATGLGGLLDATGLPDVFVGFEPLPAPPVDRPSDPAARAIAARAEASTLKVTAATCGFASVGTGFVVAAGYVVTNAHVVAGADGVWLNAGGRILQAVPVLFDPDLDVALLRVTAPLPAPLRLASADPDRGSVGATLGYPGGGPLTILPASVTGRYQAIGHDIYGAGRVPREIIELRAAIDRGDSGGPLMLKDGTVGGVVFAEARTNPEVGYALSPTEVFAGIRNGIGQVRPAATGDCLPER